MKKSQISLEFVILVGMAFIFFIGMLAVIYNITYSKNLESEYDTIYDLAKSMQEVMIIVAESEPGLIMTYEIPPGELSTVLEKYDYSISNTNNSISISSNHFSVSLPAPYNEGTLSIGENTLRNIEGAVYIE